MLQHWQSSNLFSKEYDFWMTDRSVDITLSGKTHKLNLYKPHTDKPRPESYLEDMESAQGMNSTESITFWTNIVGAAESGWDFRFVEPPAPHEIPSLVNVTRTQHLLFSLLLSWYTSFCAFPLYPGPSYCFSTGVLAVNHPRCNKLYDLHKTEAPKAKKNMLRSDETIFFLWVVV